MNSQRILWQWSRQPVNLSTHQPGGKSRPNPARSRSRVASPEGSRGARHLATASTGLVSTPAGQPLNSRKPCTHFGEEPDFVDGNMEVQWLVMASEYVAGH
jgi:hypothetical protein